MLGILRLLLAAAVAASHSGWLVSGLNPGVAAVVVFYLLAGYIMQYQIERYYTPGLGAAWRFYTDRLLRIYPIYLFVLLLAAALLLSTGYRENYAADGFSAVGMVNNLLILPQNFFMYNSSERFALIPPAWSLGTELQFYLLAPLLLFLPRLQLPAIMLSLGVFLLAAGGVLHTDYFGYRLLPGVLYIFLLGSALAARSYRLLVPGLIGALTAGWVGWVSGHASSPYLREVLVGLFLGVPLVWGLASLPQRRWDVRLGYLAYGLFLAHFLFIWLLELYPLAKAGTLAHLLLVLAGAMLVALIGHWLVDRPMTRLRRRLREAEN